MTTLENCLRDNKLYIIAEVAQTHDGSLGQAHAFIDAARDTGADAIKFQMHIADEESTEDEPFRINFSYEDESRYRYWRRMEFTREQWEGLKKHAEEAGLDFLCSPFSIEAVNILDDMGIIGWKISSGEVFCQPLMERVIETKKPMILSSGMSTIDDIDKQISLLEQNGIEHAILHCTTQYPAQYENIGLNLIPLLKARYPKSSIGFSDHSARTCTPIAAIALGATIIEVHLTLSKYMFGPDVCASLDVDGFSKMVKDARFVKSVLDSPIDKTSIGLETQQLKDIFTKGVYAKSSIKQGTPIKMEHLSFKKPFIGLSCNDLDAVIGRIAARQIRQGEPIFLEDVI